MKDVGIGIDFLSVPLVMRWLSMPCLLKPTAWMPKAWRCLIKTTVAMNTSVIKIEVPNAENVTITEDTLSVDLSDGRTLSVPLVWFPRLVHATSEERNNWRLIGNGQGIHWEDIDEDISVEGLLVGKPSGESQTSFKKWLSQRSLA